MSDSRENSSYNITMSAVNTPELLKNLSEDDRDRINLLLSDGTTLQNRGFPELPKDKWIEILFLIQRFDLLVRFFGICQKEAYEKVQRESYFDPLRRLLIRIYDEITDDCENKLRRTNSFHRDLPLSEILLRIGSAAKGVDFLRCFFADFGDVVEEIDRYTRSIDTKTYPNTYPMHSSPCGRCLIFNCVKVVGHSQRKGSEIDKDELKKLFEGLDFVVECYDDLNSEKMAKVLQEEAARIDHSKYCAFVCCIMSHGERDKFLCSDGNSLDIYEDVIVRFCGNNCEALQNKPKVFLLQACQGNNFALAGQDQQRHRHLMYDGPQRALHNFVQPMDDFILGIASVPGCQAVREDDGSWFIKAVVNAFDTVELLNMDDIKRQVNEEITKKMARIDNTGPILTQRCLFSDNLRRKLIFRRK